MTWTKNRRILVAFLVVAMLFFLVLAGDTAGWWEPTRTRIKLTEEVLEELADGYARKDQDVTTRWAKAAYHDGWGHGISLEIHPEGVQFVSAGPDGKFGTPDDIKSREVN